MEVVFSFAVVALMPAHKINGSILLATLTTTRPLGRFYTSRLLILLCGCGFHYYFSSFIDIVVRGLFFVVDAVVVILIEYRGPNLCSCCIFCCCCCQCRFWSYLICFVANVIIIVGVVVVVVLLLLVVVVMVVVVFVKLSIFGA